MKTTVEIPDPLMEQVQDAVRREHSTFRALVEEGLRLALARREDADRSYKVKNLKTQGGGIQPAFANAGWDEIRDAIYVDRS